MRDWSETAKRALGVVIAVFLLDRAVLLLNRSEERITSATKRIAENEERIRDLESKLYMLEHKLMNERQARINCRKSTPSRLESDLGALFVVCDKAEPRFDGYSVDLLLGNPSTIPLQRAELHFTWSFKPSEDPTEMQMADRAIQERLPPGSWTSFRTNLSPMTAEELANLRASLKVDVSLRGEGGH